MKNAKKIKYNDLFNYLSSYFNNVTKEDIIISLEKYYSELLNIKNIIYLDKQFYILEKNENQILFTPIEHKLKNTILNTLTSPIKLINSLEKIIIENRIKNNLDKIIFLLHAQENVIKINKKKHFLKKEKKYYYYKLSLKNMNKIDEELKSYLNLIKIKIYHKYLPKNTSNIFYIEVKNVRENIFFDPFPFMTIKTNLTTTKKTFISYLKEIFYEYFIKTNKYKQIFFNIKHISHTDKKVFISISALLKKKEIKFLIAKFSFLTNYKLEIKL